MTMIAHGFIALAITKEFKGVQLSVQDRNDNSTTLAAEFDYIEWDYVGSKEEGGM